LTLTYFTDRDLANQFPATLMGDPRFHVEQHSDHFRHDTPDPDWIVPVSDKSWIIITHDKAMIRAHFEVIVRANARVLVVVGDSFQAAATNFLLAYPVVERLFPWNPPPIAARLYLPTPSQLKRGNPRKRYGSIRKWGDGWGENVSIRESEENAMTDPNPKPASTRWRRTGDGHHGDGWGWCV
jgi:hypothetical protein